MEYKKPAFTLDQQVDQLLRRGMVGDRDLIKRRLSTVNYYRLSAYWYTFRLHDDALKAGTEFEHVWERYVFDQRLRSLVMEALERIEVATRTLISYEHAHAHGPFAYTEHRHLPNLRSGSGFGSHGDFVANVRKNVSRNSKHEFVQHFRRKYTSSSDMPIWMITEVMMLGDILMMYQGAAIGVRGPVAQAFGVTDGVFESWLLTLHNVRNICAHGSRLWNRPLAKVPRLPAPAKAPDWHAPVPIVATTLFAAMTICNYMLQRIAPEWNWGAKFRELVTSCPSIPLEKSTQGATMGLHPAWLSSPLWANARPLLVPPASPPAPAA